MKKLSLALVSIVFFITAFAQNDTCKSNISLNAGYSVISSYFDIIALFNNNEDRIDMLPAVQFEYDYSVENWFSIGGAVSYQQFNIEVTNYEYYNYKDDYIVEDFNVYFDRINIASRFLFHYVNEGKVDMYSGLRLGYTYWVVNAGTTDPDYDDFKLRKNIRIAPQLVAFGIRGYITEHFGLGAELAFGSPHFFNCGFKYRF